MRLGVGVEVVRRWLSSRGRLWFLVSLAGVLALAAAITIGTTTHDQNTATPDEAPLSASRLRMLRLAAASCPDLRPERLAGQIMAATGFEPTTEGGIGGLTEAEWDAWKPGQDAVPADESASVLALARLTCDLVGRLRADALPGDPWRLAVAAYGSTVDDVRAARGVPAQVSGFVAEVEAFTATYEKQFSAEPEPSAPPTVTAAAPTSPAPGASPTPTPNTTATTGLSPSPSRTVTSPSAQPTQPLSFPFEDFGAVNPRRNGTAHLTGGRLDLVEAKGQAGSAWATTQLNTRLSFTTSFRAVIAGPCDGIAFLLQTQGPTALGGTAAGIGYAAVYAKDDPSVAIRPSVAVEFDTYDNSPEGWDPAGHQHVAVTRNGDAKTHYAWADPGFSMSNNQTFTVWITYAANVHMLRVYVSKGTVQPATPLLTYAIDLRTALGADRAYVGFTGGSGVWFARESVLGWSMS